MSKEENTQKQQQGGGQCPNPDECPSLVEKINNLIQQKLSVIITVVNSIPNSIRDNTLFTSKLVAANLDAMTGVIANASDPALPNVTEKNMQIIKFMQSKYPEAYSKMAAFGTEMKDQPSEVRATATVKFANDVMKPLLTANK